MENDKTRWFSAALSAHTTRGLYGVVETYKRRGCLAYKYMSKHKNAMFDRDTSAH